MIPFESANHLANEWIEAWNAHDLDAIMRHYAENVEFWSPVIVRLLGIAAGKIEGKIALRAYFERGLAANPGLRFTLLQVFPGVDSIVLHFRRDDGSEVTEMMSLNAEGQVVMVRAHHNANSSVWKV